MMPLRGGHLPRIELLDEDRRLRARIGRFEINQNALLLSAALLVGVGGAYGVVLEAYRSAVETDRFERSGAQRLVTRRFLGHSTFRNP
jgi:hypothetical protein